MPPVIEAFMAAQRLPDLTVVADAGMISETTNQKAIEAAGCYSSRHGDPRRPLPGRQVAVA